MVTNKCFLLVLLFSVVLSFGLLCSADENPSRRSDPRRRFDDCQRRCQWETRGEREQERCEERCERDFSEEEGGRSRRASYPGDLERRLEECQEWCEQQGPRQQPQCQQQCRREFEERREEQEERGRRHGSNSDEPQIRYEECWQWCEQQGPRHRPQCQQQCRREFAEEIGRRHGSNPEDPQRRFEECQQRCQQQGQTQQPQCQQQCRREFEEQREQEERGHRHGSNPEDPQRRFEECQQRCQQQGQAQQPQCQQQCRREFEQQRGQQEERDPQRRFEECRQRCQQQGQKQQPQCQQQCQRELQEQRQQQGQRDPQKRFEQCQQRCQQEGQKQQPQCQQQCQREFQQQREQTQKQLQVCQQHCQQEEQTPDRKQQCERQCREQLEQQQPSRDGGNRWEEEEEEEEDESYEGRHSHNPYYFPRRRYAHVRFQEDNGNFWVFQKFSQKHHLLKGINEYRIALIEANPNTFVLPHHCDAERIYIVTNGRGTITFVTHNNKESFNVVRGVVVRIPAGSTVYLVNQDNNERLAIAVLHRPVNNPGQFEEFFPAGQEHPQSYYRSFGREILEAVFNTRSEQIDRLFHGRQSQRGMFRRASQEQIKSLSQGATTPKERESRFAFNLLAQQPKYSNLNGQFFEACPRDFKLLRHADAAVAGFEINQGSIFAPHYNSHSSFVILFTEGNGYVEMVCPHLSSQSFREEEEEEEEQEERRSGEYKRVRAHISAGDMFVVPAGHPVTYVASRNQKLRALAFGLYHQNNTRIFIAGKNNMVRQMDGAAKEISFGVPSKLVDEVFNNNPQDSYFLSRKGQGRRQRQRGSEESRGNPISSILDFARLF